jgi:hypothetical protein
MAAQGSQLLALRITKAANSGAFRATPFSKQDLPRQEIKFMLLDWDRRQQGLRTFASPVSYLDLLPTNPQNRFDYSGLDHTTFEHVASSPLHWQARDSDGNVLAYRYRLHDPDGALLKTLESTALSLPPTSKPPKAGAHRGQFAVHHYACWKAMEPRPRMSAEYLREKPYSGDFIQRNQPLFDRLAQDLRVIDPHMYARYTQVRRYLPRGVEPLAGAWHGIAVNLGQDDLVGVKTHQDWNDKRYGYNCVLPFGDYTGGALVLWQLGVVLELRPGDVVFFFGRLLAHNTEKVDSGVRNSVDLFCHEVVFKWVDTQKAKKREAAKAD